MNLKTITIFIFSITFINTNFISAQDDATKKQIDQQKLFTEAQRLVSQKQCVKAVTKLNEILKLDNKNISSLNLRAYCYMYIPDYRQALRDYSQADKISANGISTMGMQWANLVLKKYGDSITAGQKALQFSPNNYYIILRLAIAYEKNNNTIKSKHYYDMLLTKFPSTQAYWLAGLKAYRKGDYDEAEQKFSKGYNLDASHKGLRASLHLAPSPLHFWAIPFFNYYEFNNSTDLGSGRKYGSDLYFSLNDTWNFNGGYLIDDEVSYLNTDNYNTKIFRFGSDIRIDAKNSLSFQSHFLTSNASALDSSFVLSADYSYGFVNKFELQSSLMKYTDHTGFQVAPFFHWLLWGPLYSSTGVYIQLNSSESVSTSVKRNGPPGPSSSKKIQTITTTETNLNLAISQYLNLPVNQFTFGAGVIWGKLLTPVLNSGNYLIYNTIPLALNTDVYATYNFSDYLIFSATYSYTRWSAQAETITSHQIQFKTSVRFP